MQNYIVNITETLSRIVEVKSENDREALEKISKQYYDGKIILTPEDYFDVDFEVQIDDGRGF